MNLSGRKGNSMGTIKHMSSELRDWIIETLRSGVSPVVIADGLVKKGFNPRYAYESLFQIVGNEAIQTTGFEDAQYQYETPEIGRKGNTIYTNDREIKVLSKVEKPFILHLDNVLSAEECEQLISLSSERLKPSKVVDSVTGEERVASGRTSKGMYYSLMENSFIAKLEKRFEEITSYPIEHGEGLQVLNYLVGEEYKAHFDYFPTNKVDHSKGGQRIGTLLLYLNDVEEGGETVFPKAGVSIVPKKGSAVYFHYTNSMGQVDRMSVHSSIPVIRGEKWVATKWIRESKIY